MKRKGKPAKKRGALKLTPLQLLKLGLPIPPAPRGSDRWWVEVYPIGYLADAYRDLAKQNLSDLEDAKIRAKAERLSAVRFEIRRRGFTPSTLPV